MAETSRSLRIGIYGPFGWGNLGDASIQEAMLHNIRLRQPGAEIVAFSLNPDDTEVIHGVPCHPILRSWRSRRGVATPSASASESRGAESVEAPEAGPQLSSRERVEAQLARRPGLGPLIRATKAVLRPLAELAREARFLTRAKRTLEDLDVFVVSGGGQLADFWGGPFDHPFTLMKWVACARLAGCQVHVVSVGAGPIRHPLSGLFLQLTLRMAHTRSYRDRESHALVSRWGFTRRDPVYPDLAFSFPASVAPDVGSGPATVAIAPMAYFHPTPGVWPAHDATRYREYLERQAGLVRGLLRDGHRVRLMSTQIRSDRYALDDLVELLRGDDGELPDALLAEPTRALDHALEQIMSCDMVVASRLHGVILSFLCHRPVMAVSYQEKVDSVVDQFEQRRYRVDIDLSGADELLHCARQMLHEREGVQADVRARAQSHATRLQDQYDRLFGLWTEAR
jgi:polysaccharide pyruvyl transferase WcaK-like protein